MNDPLTISDVAALLSRSERTIQRWIRDGKLPCTEITENSRYITKAQLEAFFAGGNVGGTARGRRRN